MSYGKEIGQYFYDSVNDEWTVRLEDAEDGSDSWFSCKTQYEAEVLSRLVKINIAVDRFPYKEIP